MAYKPMKVQTVLIVRITNYEYLGNPDKTFEFIQHSINLIIADKKNPHNDTP